MVAGLWLGYDQPRPIRDDGYASKIAAPIWGSFMKAATKGKSTEWLQRPENLERTPVCAITGDRAVDFCQYPDFGEFFDLHLLPDRDEDEDEDQKLTEEELEEAEWERQMAFEERIMDDYDRLLERPVRYEWIDRASKLQLCRMHGYVGAEQLDRVAGDL